MAKRETEVGRREKRKKAREFLTTHGGSGHGGWFTGADDSLEDVPVHPPKGSGRVRVSGLQVIPASHFLVVDTNVLVRGVGEKPRDGDCAQIVGLIESGLFSLSMMYAIENELQDFISGSYVQDDVTLDSLGRSQLLELLSNSIVLYQGNMSLFRGLVPIDPADSVFVHALRKTKKLYDPQASLITRDAHLITLGEPDVFDPYDFLTKKMRALGILGL